MYEAQATRRLSTELVYGSDELQVNSPICVPEESMPIRVSEEHAEDKDLLEQISSTHARSFNVAPAGQRYVVWRDEFGNIFTTTNIKGNDFSNPGIIETRTAPEGYIYKGLFDTSVLQRVIDASRVLREAGVDTEVVTAVYEPGKMLFDGEEVSFEEYKSNILSQYHAETVESSGAKKANEKTVEVSKALGNMTFAVVARSLLVNERLWDINSEGTKEDFDKLMHSAFVSLKLEGQYGNPEVAITDEIDPIEYLTEILPKRLAKNFAKMHRAGLAHKFATAGNVTLSGGLVDLDSVYGEPLGDEPISLLNKIDDITYMDDFGDLAMFLHLKELGVVDNPEEQKQTFLTNLFLTYFDEENIYDSDEDMALALCRIRQKTSIDYVEFMHAAAERLPALNDVLAECRKEVEELDDVGIDLYLDQMMYEATTILEEAHMRHWGVIGGIAALQGILYRANFNFFTLMERVGGSGSEMATYHLPRPTIGETNGWAYTRELIRQRVGEDLFDYASQRKADHLLRHFNFESLEHPVVRKLVRELGGDDDTTGNRVCAENYSTHHQVLGLTFDEVHSITEKFPKSEVHYFGAHESEAVNAEVDELLDNVHVSGCVVVVGKDMSHADYLLNVYHEQGTDKLIFIFFLSDELYAQTCS